MADEVGTGRFPVPEKWILQQLPEELHGMFGYRGEPAFGDDCRDEIDYTYTVGLPDGATMKKAILVQYVPDDAPVVAFIIDDKIELEGISFTVRNWDSREIPAQHGERAYTHHEVDLILAVPSD
jgi:hypothetical protein